MSPSKSWYKRRAYPHFDNEVNSSSARNYVENSSKVSSHSFFPFIRYIKKQKKYRSTKGKTEEKERPICYSSHLDSHIYAYYSSILSKLYEAEIERLGLSENIIAYRSLGKSNIDFANIAFEQVERLAPCMTIALDIVDFFGTLDHRMLYKTWCMILGENRLPTDHYKIFRSITNYAYVDRDELFEVLNLSPQEIEPYSRLCSITEFREKVRSGNLIRKNNQKQGIPQGSPISAFLSNLFMLQFDQFMAEQATLLQSVYLRYSDDILLIVPQKDAALFVDRAKSKLSEIMLEVNDEKTEESCFQYIDGDLVGQPILRYLGFTFDGQRKLVRGRTLSRYFQKVKYGVRKASENAANNPTDKRVYRRALYQRYTHLGKQNFISYVYRAAEKMQSRELRGQVKKHWKFLHKELEKNKP